MLLVERKEGWWLSTWFHPKVNLRALATSNSWWHMSLQIGIQPVTGTFLDSIYICFQFLSWFLWFIQRTSNHRRSEAQENHSTVNQIKKWNCQNMGQTRTRNWSRKNSQAVCQQKKRFLNKLFSTLVHPSYFSIPFQIHSNTWLSNHRTYHIISRYSNNLDKTTLSQ